MSPSLDWFLLFNTVRVLAAVSGGSTQCPLVRNAEFDSSNPGMGNGEMKLNPPIALLSWLVLVLYVSMRGKAVTELYTFYISLLNT